MNYTQTLRKNVQKYVAKADENSLHRIQAILEIDMEQDWWDTLPEEIKESVNKSIKESDDGNCIPHEKIMKKYEKLLKK